MAKVVERLDEGYEVQEVEFGKVYKWHPERIVLGCECGQRISLSALSTSCVECGSDHLQAIKEASKEGRHSDQTLHPWRYSEDRQDVGLPF